MTSKNAIKLTLAILICSLSISKSKAQDSTKVTQPIEVVSLNKIRLSLLGLNFEREQKVGKTTSVYFGGGAEGTFIYQTDIFFDNNFNFTTNTKSDFKIYPVLNAGFRHYYNFEKRVKKGRKTINNNAGYLGLDVLGVIPTESDTIYGYQINVMPQWGFQTWIGRKINFKLALGPLVSLTKVDTYFNVGGKLGFNFLL